MSQRDQQWGSSKSTTSNENATLQTISIHIDLLRSHANQHEKLRPVAADYMAQHRAAEEEWESLVRTGAPTALLRVQFKTTVLMLSCAFAGKVLAHLHAKNSQYHGTIVPPLHCTGDEVNDAEAVEYALTILAESIAVCCCRDSTAKLQGYFLATDILDTIMAMYTIPREVELLRYGEGYRTSIMRVVANVTYDNNSVTAYLLEKGFIPSILSATKIDKENAGLREWAEFGIRNITAYPPVITFIKELKAQRVAPETEKELSKGGYRLTGSLECPKVSPLPKQ